MSQIKTVLITGGSGYLGKKLTRLLVAEGYTIKWLTRRMDPSFEVEHYVWDYKNRLFDSKSLENTDAIIHLAGANINAKRWSTSYKQEIYDSRILATRFLVDQLKSIPNGVKTFVSASAVGYYGLETNSRASEETDPPGTDFLAKVCRDWENEVLALRASGIKHVILRTGVVFAKGEEVYNKMMQPIRLGAGAVLGSGKQCFPWIHPMDLSNVYLMALRDERYSGVVNAVAPEIITNEELTHLLARHARRKIILPNIPAFTLKVMLGGIATSLLNGGPISAKKLESLGFQFRYRTIQHVLDEK